jgi:hypothetical protein
MNGGGHKELRADKEGDEKREDASRPPRAGFLVIM